MRKRSRGRTTAAGGPNRGGRGGGRPTRGKPTVQPPTPNPPPTIKFHQPPSIQPNHIRTIPDPKVRNGLAVNSIIMETATAAREADFYLHKKFKKLSSSILVDAAAAGVDVRRRRNGTVTPPIIPLTFHSTDQDPATLNSNQPQQQNGLDLSHSTKPVAQEIVYKPKFHKLLLEDRKLSFDSRLSSINESHLNTFQQFPAAANHQPALSSAKQTSRLDRQSLDDRISKIIDENQSILATLPEYSSRRKSHHNSGGSLSSGSPRNSRSSLSSNSTGSSLDLLEQRSIDLSMRKSSLELPKAKTILVRSQSDLSESLILRNMHLSSPLSLSSSPASLPAAADNSAEFIVPKKRRKLSPGAFCGGQVSELPRNEVKSGQDVNIVVSNHSGGAHVTVRSTAATPVASQNRKITLSSNSGGCVSVLGDHKIIMESSAASSSTNYLMPFAQQQDLKRAAAVKNGFRKMSDILPVRIAEEVGVQRRFSVAVQPIDLTTAQEPSFGRTATTHCKSTPTASKPAPPLTIPSFSKPSSKSSDMKPATATTTTDSLPKRPTTLPLRPVNQSLRKTFDHSLVLPSPDTPRGAKPYNQVYNNGHAYTYLGFKVSTRSSYTCLFRPQPMFVEQENDPKLSMYSNWQPRPKDPHAPPFNLSTNDSLVNNKSGTPPSPPNYTVSLSKEYGGTTVVNSSKTAWSTYDGSEVALVRVSPGEEQPTEKAPKSSPNSATHDKKTSLEVATTSSNRRKTSELSSSSTDDDQRQVSSSSNSPMPAQSQELLSQSRAGRLIEGGFESNEDYTYVRGRGRGRYVCEACGIRCKKPSMLRKHLKTHTDLRPYTCKLCNFSFKTKGNLTKHQKSKSHHKKCFGLGIDPRSSQSLEMIGPNLSGTDSDSDSDSEESDSNVEDEDSQESFEKEIAMSLLDLSSGVGGFQQKVEPKQREEVAEQPLSLTMKSIETPIDLSTRTTTQSSKVQQNGLLRPLVVAEAQRWQEEEELAQSGCLNLTKVLNKNVVKEEVPQEFKVEAPPAAQQKAVATVRPYEFEISKRARLSKSCSEITTLREAAPTTSSQQRVTKLHQPWLSPASEDEEEESSSTTTSETMVKDDLDNNNTEASTSTGQQEGRGLESLAKFKPQAEFREPSGAQAIDGGKAECNVCGKVFGRASQLTLHMNIHYLERPFRCDPCGVSFRTKGHLIKHRRSSSHDCKVYLTEAWGVANEENPRPFKCTDCKIAFRIHGHLAKHLRSKMHIMRMECLGKLPFGIYFEMEKSGMNLNEIDTTDCDMSLVSLQSVAKKIYGESWEERLTVVPPEEQSAAGAEAEAAAV